MAMVAGAKKIIREELAALESEFKIVQAVDLRPFDTEHAFAVCRKK